MIEEHREEACPVPLHEEDLDGNVSRQDRPFVWQVLLGDLGEPALKDEIIHPFEALGRVQEIDIMVVPGLCRTG